METENAEQLILSIIENNPGIQPSSLETILVRKEDKSQNGISRPRLYRILKSLQDQGLVEVEKEKGKKEARYYLKGRRPTIVRDSNPSYFDEFVVRECENTLRNIVNMSNPSLESQLNSRIISTFKLVRTWEEMRGKHVTRTWGSDVPEFTIGMGNTTLGEYKGFIVETRIDSRQPTFLEWRDFFVNAIDQISRFYSYHPVRKKYEK
jgi:Fe2+ or Zn2+ uptake regulation protein